MSDDCNKSVDAMNKAFESDQNAIRSLMINRIPCNEALANDKLVQVGVDENTTDCGYYIGALGLVNAVLAANNLPLVDEMWEKNPNEKNIFVGFCEYKPEDSHQ